MKTSEIRDKSQEELKKLLKELKAKNLMLRFQLATNQLSNPREINNVKKLIARVMTIMKENELDEIKTKNKAANK